ncbi:MAG: RNA recognition motif domain-containing protein [bacterium]
MHEIFEKHGEIKYVKLSYDENHRLKGYGIVCFRD